MKRKNQGFTLVELLIVIVIMGMLLALLAPAMGSTRERARGMGCASNLRQQGMGIEMYADEHNNAIPTVPELANYIDDPDAFVCPRDERPEEEFIAKGIFKHSYTTHLATPKTNLLADISGGYTSCIILVESDQAGLKSPSEIGINDVTFRHRPLTYALHLDGHVQGYTSEIIGAFLGSQIDGLEKP